MFFVLVNDTKFSFDTLSSARSMFDTFKNFPGGSSFKVYLYDSFGALIDKNDIYKKYGN